MDSQAYLAILDPQLVILFCFKALTFLAICLRPFYFENNNCYNS